MRVETPRALQEANGADSAQGSVPKQSGNSGHRARILALQPAAERTQLGFSVPPGVCCAGHGVWRMECFAREKQRVKKIRVQPTRAAALPPSVTDSSLVGWRGHPSLSALLRERHQGHLSGHTVFLSSVGAIGWLESTGSPHRPKTELRDRLSSGGGGQTPPRCGGEGKQRPAAP